MKLGIIGNSFSGKTTTAQVVYKLLKSNFSIGGFVQKKILNYDESIAGYDLLNLNTGISYFLAKKVDNGYLFNPDVWNIANDILKNEIQKNKILLVDELGKLEAQGQGHMINLEKIFKSNKNDSLIWIFCIRKDCKDNILKQTGILDFEIESARSFDLQIKIAQNIKKFCLKEIS